MYLKGGVGCPPGPKSATVYDACFLSTTHKKIYPFNYSSHQKCVGITEWTSVVIVWTLGPTYKKGWAELSWTSY